MKTRLGIDRQKNCHALLVQLNAARPFGAVRDVTDNDMTRPPKLFAAWYYIANHPGVAGNRMQAWQHFCRIGFKQNLDPHPMFDTRLYREQHLAGQPDVNPLLHYIRRPNQRLQTHRLFDCNFFVEQLTTKQLQSKAKDQTWLECLLNNGHVWNIDPSPDFSSQRYLEIYPEVAELNVSPLFHYLAHGQQKGRRAFHRIEDAPALFDSSYYLRENEDVCTAGLDPWQHYCEFGMQENLNPHPIFHTAFYREKYLEGDPTINPLLDYTAHRGAPRDTHPLFWGNYYLSQIDAHPDEMTPLEHFLKFNQKTLVEPSPLFCPKRYLRFNPDMDCPENSLYHYLAQGRAEGRKSFLAIGNLDKLEKLTEKEMELLSHFSVPNLHLIHSLSRLCPEKPTLLCVSHAASQAGPPRILYKIAEQLQAKYDTNILNLLCHGGELLDDFEMLGPTACLQGSDSCTAYDRELIQLLSGKLPPLAILVNSVESRHLLPELSRLRAPIHTLVHEDARCYKPEALKPIAKFSERVIFPSPHIAQAAFENTEFQHRQTKILPQGLLNEALLKTVPDNNEIDIRQQWGIPSTTTLVLGCGTGNGRKGLDLFVATALSVINSAPEGNIVFGWLGKLPSENQQSCAFWAEKDVEAAGRQDYIRFFGSVDDVTPYFQSADLFYLPSRMDSFPCAVQEAMAAGKPVVLFERGGGSVDIIGTDGGTVVPFGDVSAAANEIIALCDAPGQRQAMGARNREFVENHLKFEDYTTALADHLLESIGSSKHTQAQQANTFRSRVCGVQANRPRVLFTLPGWSVSGVNTFVENLVRQLRQEDYDASILFTTRHPDQIEESQMPQVPYRFLAARTVSPEETRRRLKDHLSAIAPCVFVPNYDYVASSIATQLPSNVGVLGVLHSDEDEHYLHAYQMGHYWDAMVAVSQTIASKMLQLNPAFKDRLTTIPYGVPLPSPRAPQETYSTTIRIAYCGRLVQEQKRILDFIPLVQQLETNGLQYQLSLIGDGPEKEQLASRLKPFIETDKVRLTGRLSPQEVRQELQQHDVFALMSDYEGLPLSLLEAMAVECVPVVTAIESGVNEILKDTHNALISPKRDPLAMAENIMRLHKNPAFRVKLGQASRQTLDRHSLTTAAMGCQYQAVIEQIFKNLSQGEPRKSPPLHCPRVQTLLDAA